MKTLVLSILTLVVSTAIVAAVNMPTWERAHGYPFGQMCNSVFTGYVDTCARTAGIEQ